jgi:hypothetical protein
MISQVKEGCSANMRNLKDQIVKKHCTVLKLEIFKFYEASNLKRTRHL